MDTELIQKFNQAREEFLKTLDNFPAERREEILFGSWNLKQVIAHYSAWDLYFTRVVHGFRTEEPVAYWGDIDEFNQKEVEARQDWSWDDVHAEFLRAGQEFIDEMSLIPIDLSKQRIWSDLPYTLRQILEINLEHYQESQYPQIKKLAGV